MKTNDSKEGKITMKKIKILLTRIACFTLALLVASGSTLVYADNGSFSIGDQEIFDALPDGTIVHATCSNYVEEGTAYTTNKILKVLVRDSGAIGGIRTVFNGTEDFDDNIRVVTPTGNVAFTGDIDTATQRIPVSITYGGVNTYDLIDPVYVYYRALLDFELPYITDYRDPLDERLVKQITVYSPESIGSTNTIYPTNDEWSKVSVDFTYTDTGADMNYVYKGYDVTVSYDGTRVSSLTKGLSVIQPTIIYDANGGTGNVPIPNTVAKAGTKDIVLGNPGGLTKDGKAFVEWNTAPDGSGSPYKENDFLTAASHKVEGNPVPEALQTVLYAIYEEDTTPDPTPEPEVEYTVTYDTSAKGALGTITDNSKYKAGDEVTILDCSNSAASGYEVEGIYENADYSGTKYSAGDKFTIASDKTFFVRYEAVGYHLSFNKNGGNGDLAEDTTVYNSGDIAVLPSLSSLTREGYRPLGFSTSPLTLSKSATLIPIGSNFMCGMDMIYTAKCNIYDNTLLYVVWQEVEIVAENYITYLPNGGVGLAPVDSTNYSDIYNMNFTAKKNTFSRENYDFSGWNTKADGSGTTILEDEVRTAFTVFVLGTGKLYAQWTPKATPTPDPTPEPEPTPDPIPELKQHRILYSMGVVGPDIPGIVDNTVYSDGDTVNLIQPAVTIVTYPSYNFIFKGYDYADTFILTNDDAEYIWVTAIWEIQTTAPSEEKFRVYYSAGAESTVIVPSDKTEYTQGDIITVLNGVIVDGYTFKGYWCTELGKLVQPGEQFKMGSSDLHLVAMLEKNEPPVDPDPSPEPEPSPEPTPEPEPPVNPDPNPEPTPEPEPPVDPEPSPEPTPEPEPPINPDPNPEPTPTPEPTPEPPVVIIPTPDPVPPVDVTPDPITPEEPKAIFGKVYGVIRGVDGKPKQGVRVELHSNPRITYTDSEGRYSFDNVEMGNHTLILKDPRTLEILGVNTVIVHDVTTGNKQEIQVNDTTDMVTGAVSLDETLTERQIDFELVKDLVGDIVEEEPDEDDTIKEEDKIKEKEEDTDTDKTAEDKTGKEEETVKNPTEVEDKGETEKPTPTPSVIDPEPTIEPEDDPLDLDVTSGIEGTEEPQPTPTPTPEVVDPTPTPNPIPDKPVPNPIIPIVIAVIGTVTTASVFYFLFIFVRRRKYIYAVIQDIEGNVVDPKRNIYKVDKMLARVNLSDIEDILGTLKGVTVTIEQATANKLAGYKLEIVVKDEIIKTYQFDTGIEADVIVTL